MKTKNDQGEVVPGGAVENLDGPLDPELEIEGGPRRTSLNLVAEGEVISRLSVVHFTQQIGSETVRMGGIAGVRTFEAHQHKGYARRLMTSALRWMRREEFDTTMLYGIRDFYTKFGYAPAFPDVSYSIAVRDAGTVQSREYTVADYRPEHLKATIRLYHKTNAGRTGPTRRDARYWKPWARGLGWRTEAVCKLLLDRARNVAAYLVYNAEAGNPVILEVGYTAEAVFPGLVQAATQIAWEQRVENIRLVLPEDEPFIEYCIPLGIRKEVRYRRDGGAMVRMINSSSALKKLSSRLARRLTGAGCLNLYTNLDNVSLPWRNGRVSVGTPRRGAISARLPQWALAQMIYGYRDAPSLASSGVLSGSKNAITILSAMFPRRPHFHYTVDEF